MTEVYLLLNAAILGVLTLAIIGAMVVVIINGSATRRHQAAAEEYNKETHNSLLASLNKMGVVPVRVGGPEESIAQPPCSASENACPSCKSDVEAPGQYI